MSENRLGLATIAWALAVGWRTANAARGVSIAYAGVFTLIGLAIMAALAAGGRTPFVVPAAGAFMLVGPAILAGFFAVAREGEAGRAPTLATVFRGFAQAAPAVWVLALVCALLFMIFVTDVAILYSYMIGGTPIFPPDMLPTPAHVANFMVWSLVSGWVIAFMLYAVSAFSVPLLCERRANLVQAVVASVRVVFRNFVPAMLWAAILSVALIGSILLLPLFPLALPVLAYASHALYREVLPRD